MAERKLPVLNALYLNGEISRQKAVELFLNNTLTMLVKKFREKGWFLTLTILMREVLLQVLQGVPARMRDQATPRLVLVEVTYLLATLVNHRIKMRQ